MANTGTKKAKSSSLLDELETHEERRREDEEVEQQDLNQGMDTGTHDSTRSGVAWGASYRSGSKEDKPRVRSSKLKKSAGPAASKRRDKK